MSQPDNSENVDVDKSSLTKHVRTALGALVLAIVASALWDFLFKNAFIALGGAMLGAIASVWSGYVDILHVDIGKLQADVLVLPIFSFLVAALIVGLVSYVIRTWGKLKKYEERVKKYKERIARVLERPLINAPISESISKLESELEIDPQIYTMMAKLTRLIVWGLTPSVAILVFLIAIQAWQVTYTRSASTWSVQSIEILAPNIGNEEVVKLRSQLRQVITANQFYAFESALRAHAKKHAVQLPKFSSIGNTNSN